MDNYKDAIFEPLEYYVNYGKDTHKKIISKHSLKALYYKYEGKINFYS